jgi:hypothetical protein
MSGFLNFLSSIFGEDNQIDTEDNQFDLDDNQFDPDEIDSLPEVLDAQGIDLTDFADVTDINELAETLSDIGIDITELSGDQIEALVKTLGIDESVLDTTGEVGDVITVVQNVDAPQSFVPATHSEISFTGQGGVLNVVKINPEQLPQDLERLLELSKEPKVIQCLQEAINSGDVKDGQQALGQAIPHLLKEYGPKLVGLLPNISFRGNPK